MVPSIFSADATLDEIFDTYFDDSKWDNYKEDGIRDSSVTGVQTCALPIFYKICF